MPRLVEQPTRITAAGNKPKQIEEFAGRMNSGHDGVSVARMKSTGGWSNRGSGPSSRKSPWCSQAGCGSSTKGASSTSTRAKPSSANRASGFATARPMPRVRITWPSAARRFHRQRCIETRPTDDARRQIPNSRAVVKRTAAEPGSGTEVGASEPLPGSDSPKCDFQTP